MIARLLLRQAALALVLISPAAATWQGDQALIRQYMRFIEGDYKGTADGTQEFLSIRQNTKDSWTLSMELSSDRFHADALTVLTLSGERLMVGRMRDGSDACEAKLVAASNHVLIFRADSDPDDPDAPVYTERLALEDGALVHQVFFSNKAGEPLASRSITLRRLP